MKSIRNKRRLVGLYWVILMPDGKWVKEHRILMENKIGRKLLKSEHVHHINGSPIDNRIQNLQILICSEHMKLHAVKRTYVPHSEKTKIKISNATKESWKNGKYNNFERWEKIKAKKKSEAS